jgi:ATPase subunit of ABC transporter with duplicated ATPase domains
MGILVSVEKISHEWPTKEVVKDVSLGIFEGDRIGIVGKNGDGKSTLLEILSKEIEPDSGSVVWRNNLHVGVLDQFDSLDDEATVETALFGDTPRHVWAGDPKVRQILKALVDDIELDRTVGTLSGGQRRRVDLARLLAGDWDVLLLDEPTNHLDMPAITWLADHLKNRWQDGQGALLCVTHDRWFLDEVATGMWEVHDAQVEPFEGGYSAYIQQRFERERVARVREERRQSMLRKELAWLSRGAQARSTKPKFRVEAARAMLADDPPLRNTLELKRMAMSRLGKQVFELDGVDAGFGDEVVLEDIDWLIGPGDRIGILGVNGAGKSTLLKTILGRIAPLKGRVKQGASVKLGVLSQHMDLLDGKDDWKVADLLGQYKKTYIVGGKETTPSALLEQLGFEPRQIWTPIGDLSGGQKRRLALMCVLLDEPNVLVLDEPGNDLDTDMLAVMEDLLDSWPGTLLLVTHDRYLMERVTDDQYAILGKHVRHMPGGVDQFLKLLAEPGEESAAASAAEALVAEKPKAAGNVRRETKKRFDAVDRKLPKLKEQLEKDEAALAATDATDYAALMAAQQVVADRKAEIDALEDEWLELSMQLEEM